MKEAAELTIIIAIAVGLAGSLVIGGIAYWKRSLSGSGLAAAVVLGTTLYAISNIVWYGTLIAFFVSSTLLSKIIRGRKAEAEQHYEKGGRRDAGQVMANGGLPLVAAVGHFVYPHPGWWYICLGSLAAVNADTWATELGALSRSLPRSIVNGRRVSPGTSGGITPAGLTASLAGGCFIGLSAFLLSVLPGGSPSGEFDLGAGAAWMLAAGAAGLIGSLFDSLLGATVQSNYRCGECGRIVEKSVHCGRTAVHAQGWKWLRNDQVNFAAAVCGAIVCYVFGLWL